MAEPEQHDGDRPDSAGSTRRFAPIAVLFLASLAAVAGATLAWRLGSLIAPTGLVAAIADAIEDSVFEPRQAAVVVHALAHDFTMIWISVALLAAVAALSRLAGAPWPAAGDRRRADGRVGLLAECAIVLAATLAFQLFDSRLGDALPAFLTYDDAISNKFARIHDHADSARVYRDVLGNRYIVAMLAAQALLNPVIDELIFRGHLFDLSRRAVAERWVAPLSHAAFLLFYVWMGVSPMALLPMLVVSIVALRARRRTEGVIAPILVNGVMTTTSFALFVASLSGFAL